MHYLANNWFYFLVTAEISLIIYIVVWAWFMLKFIRKPLPPTIWEIISIKIPYVVCCFSFVLLIIGLISNWLGK